MATTTVINWDNRSTSAISAGWVSCAYGASLYVAVSYSSYKIMTSSDGLTWTISTFIPTLRIKKIIYASGLFVAIGDLNTVTANVSQLILTSPDGLNWTYRTSPKTAPLYAVTYGNGLFVATGNGNSLITSSNGIDWTLKTITPIIVTPGNTYALSQTFFDHLEFGNNIFLGVSSNPRAFQRVISTDNGLTWKFYTGPYEGEIASLMFCSLNNLFYFIARYDFKTFVVKTSDGINVTRTDISTSLGLGLNAHNSIAYGNNMFVIVGDNHPIGSGCRISYDGDNWDWTTMPGNTVYTFVGFLNNKFIALAGGSGRPIFVVVGTQQTKLKAVLSNFNDVTRTYTTTPFVIPYPTSNHSGSFYNFFTGNSYIASNYRYPMNTFSSGGTGTTWVTAVQDENANYALATIRCLLTVNKADPVISNFNDIIKKVGDANFTLTKPTSNSNGAFTYISSNTSVATISGSTVSVIGAGIAIITASQAQGSHPQTGGIIYNTTSITCSLRVNKSIPTISSFNITEKTFGDSSFDLPSLTSDSPGLFTYSSSNTLVATIFGSTVSVVGAGTATITVTQAESSNFLSATKTFILTVSKAKPVLSGFINLLKTFGDSLFSLDIPKSISPGVFTFSSSNTKVVSIIGKNVTIVGAGIATITATQAETDNYLAEPITCLIIINKRTTILSNFSNLKKTFGDNIFTLSQPTSSRTQFI